MPFPILYEQGKQLKPKIKEKKRKEKKRSAILATYLHKMSTYGLPASVDTHSCKVMFTSSLKFLSFFFFSLV